jgi:hypothetical protein
MLEMCGDVKGIDRWRKLGVVLIVCSNAMKGREALRIPR